MDHWWPAGHGIGWEHSFVHENDEFLRHVDDGTRHRPDFADAYAVQAVVEAIVESDESGAWVDV
jgi:predicted dehydrogenase